MENQITQPFIYNGQVTVSAVNGKTVFYKYSFHNAGTTLFFEGLCHLLAGEPYESQKARLPQFIRLYHGETPLTDSAFKYNTTIQVKTTSENKYVTVLHFAIPAGQIKASLGTIDCLKLFGEKATGGATEGSAQVLAVFTIPDGADVDPADFTPNTQYLVEWSIGFDNQKESGTNSISS